MAGGPPGKALGQAGHAVGVAHVERKALRARIDGRGVAIDRNHVVPARQQRVGQRPTDAGGRAGDDRERRG